MNLVLGRNRLIYLQVGTLMFQGTKMITKSFPHISIKECFSPGYNRYVTDTGILLTVNILKCFPGTVATSP